MARCAILAAALVLVPPQTAAASVFEGTVSLRDLVPAGVLSSSSSDAIPRLSTANSVADYSRIAIDVGLRMTDPGTSSPLLTIDQLLAFALNVSWPDLGGLSYLGYELLADGAAVSTGTTWVENDIFVRSSADFDPPPVGSGFVLIAMRGAQGVDPINFPNVLCGDFCQWPSLARLYFRVSALSSGTQSLSINILNRVSGIVDHRGSSLSAHSTGMLTLAVRSVESLELELPAAVEVLRTVPVAVSPPWIVLPEDADGNRLYGDILFSSATVLTLSSLDGSALASTHALSTTGTLTLRVDQARDGAQALLELSDRGLTTTAALTMDVRVSALSLSLQSSAPGNGVYALQLSGVDARGNIDTDYAPSSLSTTPPTLTVQSLVGNLLSLQAQPPLAQPVVLTVTDDAPSGRLTGSLSLSAVARLVATVSPPVVVSGRDFELAVTALNYAGDPSAFALSASATVSISVAGGEVAVIGRASSALTLQVVGIADNMTAQLTVVDQGLTATATVRVSVEATALSVTAADLGQAFELRVSGVDAAGAVDVDYQLGSAAVAASSMAQVVESSRTSASLRVSLSAIGAGVTTVLVTVTDGALSGSVVLPVDVTVVALKVIDPPARATPGTSYTLAVRGVNALGNPVSGFALSPTAVLTAPGALTSIRWGRLPGNALEVVFESVPGDGVYAVVQIHDAGLTGTWEPLIDVEAEALALSLGATVSPSALTQGLGVSGVDRFGNTDTDYALPTTASLVVRPVDGDPAATPVYEAVGVLSFPGLSAIEWRLSQALDGSVLLLRVAAGSLVGESTLLVTVDAARFVLSAPDLVPVGSAFVLAVRAFDQLGNEDFDYTFDFPMRPTLSVADVSSPSLSVVFTVALAGDLALSVRLLAANVQDGQVLRFSLSDSGVFGATTATVTTGAMRLALAAGAGSTAGVVVSGSTFTVTVTPLDARGLVDSLFELSGAVAVAVLDSSATATLIGFSTSTRSVTVRVQGALDNSTFRLVVGDDIDGRPVSGDLVLQLAVVAEALRLDAPPVAIYQADGSTSFNITLIGVNALGERDVDFALSPQAEISTTSIGTTFTLSASVVSADTIALSLSAVAGNGVITLRVRDQDVVSDVAAVQLRAGLSRIDISLSTTTVTAGASFTLRVAPYDHNGLLDPSFALRDAWQLDIGSSVGDVQFSSSLVYATELSLRVLQVVDNSLLSLRLSDQGFVGETTAVVVVVVTELSAASLPETLVPGRAHTLRVLGLDALGNEDLDYTLPLGATLSAQSGGVELAAVQRVGDGFEFSLGAVLLDKSYASLRLDDGQFRRDLELLVEVVADRFKIVIDPLRDTPAGTVRPHVDGNSLLITAEDAFGNLDFDFGFNSTLALTVEPVAAGGVNPVLTVGEPVFLGAISSVQPIQFASAEDGSVLRFTVAGGGVVSATTAVVTVETEQLSVRAGVDLVALNVVFALFVRAADALGNENVDYALSSSFSLSLDAGVGFSHERAGARELALRLLSGLSEGQVVTVTLSDLGYVAATTVVVTVGAVRIVLESTPTTAVVAGDPFMIQVIGYNALDELVGNLSLSQVPVVMSSPVVGRIVRLVDGGQDGRLSVILTSGVVDGSTITLTVTLHDQALAPLSASVVVAADVRAARLLMSIASAPPCALMAVCSESGFTLSISGADSRDNVDNDFIVSDALVPVAVGGGVSIIERLAVGRYALRLSAGRPEASSLILFATDQGFDGSVRALVDVETSQLRLAVVPAPSLVIGSSFTVRVAGADVYGQADGDFDLAETMPQLSATDAGGASLRLSAPQRSGNDLIVALLDDVVPGDQVTLRLTVGDGRFAPVETIVEALADSGALRFVPPSPAPVSIGEAIELRVQWLDSAYRLDVGASGPAAVAQLRLSPALAAPYLLSDPVEGISTLTLVVDAQQQVADHSVLELTLSHPSLSSTSVSVELDVRAARLALVAPTTPVASFSTFTVSITARDLFGNEDEDYPLSSVVLGTGTAGAVLEPIGSPDAAGRQLARLSGVADGTTATLVASVADASLGGGSAVVTVDVVASALGLSALPAYLAAGQGMLVTLSPRDAAGFVDLEYQLSEAPTLALSAGEFSTQPVGRGQALLLLSAVSAPPVGSTLTLTVRDAGLGGSLAVPVRAAASTGTLSISTATVVVGETVALRISLRDSHGNVLAAPALSSQTVVVVDGPARHSVSLERGTAGTSTVVLTVLEAQDGSTALLYVLDPVNGLVAVAALPLDVRADRLRIEPRGPVPLDQVFTLVVSAVDAVGNLDADYRYTTSALSVSTGNLTVVDKRGRAFDVVLAGDFLIDGQQVVFTAADDALPIRVTTLGLTVDVVAVRFALSAPDTVSPATAFTLSATGLDARDRRDVDFAFSPTVTLTAVGIDPSRINYQSAASAALSVELLAGFVDGFTIALRVSDQGLSSTATLTVDVVADRLAVALEGTSTQEVALHTTLVALVRYVDRYGNEDADLAGIDSALNNGDLAGISVLNNGVALVATADFSIAEQGKKLLVRIRYATDHAETVLLFRDAVSFADGSSGSFEGATTTTVNVLGTMLRLAVPPSDPPTVPPAVPTAQQFPLAVEVVDSYGNVDLDATLSAASFSVGSVSTGDPTALVTTGTLSLATRQLLVTLGGLPEGTEIELRVDGTIEGPGLPRTEGELGRISLQLDVVATRLALSPDEAVVTPGTSATFVVGGLDIFNQVDADYALSAGAAISVSSPAQAAIERTTSTNVFEVRVLRAAGDSVFRLSVDDGGGRVGHSTLTAVLDIAELVFVGPSTVQVGVYTPLSIGALDALGNFDSEIALSTSSALAAVSIGAQLDFRHVADGIIELRLKGGVVEGQPVEFLISDASHSTVAAVIAVVEGTRLGLEVPDYVIENGRFSVRLLGRDDYGNVDVDFVMSTTASLTVAAPGALSLLQRTPAAPGVSTEDANRIAATISGLSAGQTAFFTAADLGRVATAQIVVTASGQAVATQLRLQNLPGFAVTNSVSSLPIGVVGIDDFGNIDNSYVLPGLSSLTLSVQGLGEPRRRNHRGAHDWHAIHQGVGGAGQQHAKPDLARRLAVFCAGAVARAGASPISGAGCPGERHV